MDLPLAVEIAAVLARRWEGLRLRPYLCPAGVATIGYGATHYENGVRVTLHDPPITRERADELLLWMVKTKYLPATLLACPNIDSPRRLGAITDFVFNLGESKFRNSILRKRIAASRWADVPEQLMRWRFGGGKELRGLVLRRQAEAALI